MNHKFKRIAAAVLSLGILFSSGMTAYATSKEEAKQKIAQLKQEQAQLESRLSELQAHKEDTEAYIRELDAEMETVITQIQETNERLDAINEKLEETEVKLQEAQDKADRQYAALKVRIKQMYEEGDTSLWDIIMKSSDISAILNSSEYISQISDYDNRLLADFNETLKLIEAYKAELEEQKAEQEQIKSELEIQQDSLQSIIDQKNEELASLGIDIENLHGEMEDTEAELADTQAILDAIAAAEAAAQLAAQQAAQQAQGSSGSSSIPSNSGATSSGFIFPCGGYTVCGFGPRVAPTAGASTYHMGIDIAAGAGSGIYSSKAGVVAYTSYDVARGNYVVVNHGDGTSTLYQHCSAIYVSAGQSVSQGQTIAAVGSTGYSTGPHLHFEILVNGVNVDPAAYL